jgi:hypothetical protein
VNNGYNVRAKLIQVAPFELHTQHIDIAQHTHSSQSNNALDLWVPNDAQSAHGEVRPPFAYCSLLTPGLQARSQKRVFRCIGGQVLGGEFDSTGSRWRLCRRVHVAKKVLSKLWVAHVAARGGRGVFEKAAFTTDVVLCNCVILVEMLSVVQSDRRHTFCWIPKVTIDNPVTTPNFTGRGQMRIDELSDTRLNNARFLAIGGLGSAGEGMYAGRCDELDCKLGG